MSKKKRIRRGRPARCPCGSGERYAGCCRPYHRGDAVAQTADMLVRTRYAAYAIGEVDYVVETTEPGSPAWGSDERRWRAEIEEFSEGVRFTGVEILAHHEEVDAARVTFHAGLQRARGRRRVDASFVEESEFVRRDGRWLYSRGDVRRPDAGDPDAGDE